MKRPFLRHSIVLLLLFLVSCAVPVVEEPESPLPEMPAATVPPKTVLPSSVTPPLLSLRRCTEAEYWQEVSAEYPYPGMGCDSGPSKTIGVTFIIAKGIGSDLPVDFGSYTPEEAAQHIVQQLNSAFNSHGINFELSEIKYATISSPPLAQLTKTGGKGALEGWYNQLLEEQYNPNNLNFVFKPYPGFSCPGDLWQLAEHVGKPRCQSAPSPIFPTPMFHEAGHFFGLLHTQHTAGYTGSAHEGETASTQEADYQVRGPRWTTPVQDCHTSGDYICDTPYDCFDFCEEARGCQGFIIDPASKRLSPDPACGEYNPIRTNIMSYYPEYSRGTLTQEQGARARYFLQYRLTHTLQGNTLRMKR